MQGNTSHSSQIPDLSKKKSGKVSWYLAIVVLLTLIAMSVFELIKLVIHPYMAPWGSRMLTILLSTTISGCATYLALSKYNRLNQQLTREILTRKKLEEELIIAATTDKLTQIYNRRKLEEIAQYEIERAKRYNIPLSFIMLDLDDFKQVNDTYGHQTGDRVLRTVSDIIMSNIRASDTAGRWGGEEFMILVPETALDNARELAEKIRNLIASYPFELSRPITISLGLAQLLRGDTFDSFIRRVDDALYRAKRQGKNRVEALY